MKEIDKEHFELLKIDEYLIMKVKRGGSFEATVSVDSLPTSSSVGVIIKTIINQGQYSKVQENSSISADREELYFL